MLCSLGRGTLSESELFRFASILTFQCRWPVSKSAISRVHNWTMYFDSYTTLPLKRWHMLFMSTCPIYDLIFVSLFHHYWRDDLFQNVQLQEWQCWPAGEPRQWTLIANLLNYPDSKVHGTNMRPIWGRQDTGRPHIGPCTLLSGYRWILTYGRMSLTGLQKCMIIFALCLFCEFCFGTNGSACSFIHRPWGAWFTWRSCKCF